MGQPITDHAAFFASAGQAVEELEALKTAFCYRNHQSDGEAAERGDHKKLRCGAREGAGSPEKSKSEA